ncbi:hypothetical protein SCHPADRAFT_893755 [Schizopora paradoxa]|uniref:Uncharacterized protein n=1 Tax=Schizopora paradoxa TaxID=27342 RepID=A0A0H2RB42_9AGAM|nr:hypothetical protein SCHPADRAFT_893755 [Schizopora paradoxa]
MSFPAGSLSRGFKINSLSSMDRRCNWRRSLPHLSDVAGRAILLLQAPIHPAGNSFSLKTRCRILGRDQCSPMLPPSSIDAHIHPAPSSPPCFPVPATRSFYRCDCNTAISARSRPRFPSPSLHFKKELWFFDSSLRKMRDSSKRVRSSRRMGRRVGVVRSLRPQQSSSVRNWLLHGHLRVERRSPLVRLIINLNPSLSESRTAPQSSPVFILQGAPPSPSSSHQAFSSPSQKLRILSATSYDFSTTRDEDSLRNLQLPFINHPGLLSMELA